MGLDFYFCTKVGSAQADANPPMPSPLKHLLPFLIAFSLVRTGAAQHSPLAFDQLTAEDGLSHSTVYALLQDQDGLVWIGTRYGLNRYDGYECKVFLPNEADKSSLGGPTVYSLFEDSKGKIWVGHREAGISVWDKNKGRFERFPEAADPSLDWPKASVRCFFEDSRGWLWVGTLGGGAFVFDEKRQQIARFCVDCQPKSKAISGDFVFDFVEDKNGIVWIATDGLGINGYDAKKQVTFHLDSGEPLNMTSFEKSMCLDKNGRLWVGTSGSGLYRFDTAIKRFTHYFQDGKSTSGLSHNLITDLVADSLGQIWIATDGGGLNILDPASGKFKVVGTSPNFPQALNTNAIYRLMFDRIGNLWVGTFNGGVNIQKAFKPPFFVHENLQEYRRLGMRSVLAIQEDQAGKIWIGSDGGGLFFAEAKGNGIALHTAAGNGLPKVVTCLEKGADGGLWVGSYAQGLHFFDEKTSIKRHFETNANAPRSLSHNNVWDLAADKQGGLWIGTLGGGLDYLPPGSSEFRHYKPMPGDANSLSSVQIVDVLFDKNGRYLWAASEDKGLNRISVAEGTIKRYEQAATNPALQLSGDNLQCLFQDKMGRIWVGTEFDGLNCIEEGKGRILHYRTDNGLPSNMIISITEDDNGYLWIGTQKGIVRFDPKANVFADFGSDDNLKNNHYNPRAALRLSNGRLVFGGTNGFSILLPDNIEPNPNAPTTVFTDLKLAGQSVPIGEWNGRTVLNGSLNAAETVVKLTYADRGIVFDFTATDFTNPSKNRFAYQLDGFDSDWNLVGADHHRAVFSNLSGGSYRLRVKASNSDGVWGPETVMNIVVQPPFWKAWWFVLLCILAIAGIAFLSFKYVLDHQKSAFQAASFKAEQEILRLKNEGLQKEVEANQGKLSASVLQSAHKNQFLIDLKAQIQKIEGQQPQELRKVVRSIDNELNQEDYWEQFQLAFNQMHQEFVHKMQERHPDISNNDLRLCCFIRMGMSNAEVATILNITVNGVEQSKYRLKRKIGLDKEATLNDYIKAV